MYASNSICYHQSREKTMILMSRQERRAYLIHLRPYLATSVFLFGVGTVIGLMVIHYFPEVGNYFKETIAAFVKTFAGLPRLKLAGAIFLNNAAKTLLAILLGTLLGIVPGFFLVANGVALGVAWSLSTSMRGPWLSLLSLLPHGVLELPAVFLGTSIGMLIGGEALKQLTGKPEARIGAELATGLRFFCTVIVPLLFVAALVEAFITAALVSG
jgi:stage II sporulation protein M